MRHRLVPSVALALTGGLLVAGCGGAPPSSPSAPPSSTAPAPSSTETADAPAAGGYTLLPGADNDPTLVDAAVAFLGLRLPGAQVEANGLTISVTFDDTPPADLAELISSDADVQWRPVLEAGEAATAPEGLDCTAPTGTVEPADPDAEATLCAADGSAWSRLGPAALTGGHVAQGGLQDGAALLQLDAEGTAAVASLSADLVGNPAPTDRLALVADGLVLTAPQMMSAITNGAAQFAGDEGLVVLGALMYGTDAMTWSIP